MSWGWVFVAEAVLFVVVLGGIGLSLVERLKRLRAEVVRLQAVVPASPVPTELARLAASRAARGSTST